MKGLRSAVCLWAQARPLAHHPLPAHRHGEFARSLSCSHACALLPALVACTGSVGRACPQRLMGALQLGLACVYCITAGKSMHAVWGYLCTEPCRPFGLSAWIVVFAGLQLILSQVGIPADV